MPDDLTGPARLRALIRGQVQMVGFRAFAEGRAHSYGLTGYVRNLATDEVEVVAEGDRALLEEFLADLRRGPRAARVTEVLASWEQPRGEFRDFWIRH